MRFFNKFVESKKEPSNKNDIWFDGSVFKIYKEGEWRTITLTKEAIDRIIEYAKSLDIYVMVKELPEFGEKGKIYVLQTIVGDSIELSEYVWEDDSWKLVDNFNSVSLVLDSELSETSHNGVANYVITEALNTKVNKSELATPDWNALEGEDGYIKNRTHFFEWRNKPEDENFNDLLLGLKDKTPISVTDEGYIRTVKYLANECASMLEQDFEYFDKYWEANYYNILDGFVTVPDIFGGNASPKISISRDYDDGDNELIHVTVQWYTDYASGDVNKIIDQICSDYYIIPYHNYDILELNDKYISSNIARTAYVASKQQLTELSAEVGKKVDADKVATINGQSLINGGNIKIDTTTHEGGLIDGLVRLKFQYDADRRLYEAKVDVTDMSKIYQDFRFYGIGGTVRHLHEVDLYKPNNIIMDADGAGNIIYGTLVFIDQESPEQEYVYYQISEEDWNYHIADSFYNGTDTTLLPVSEILIPESIARKEYVNERIEDIEVFVEDLQNTKIDKEADDYYPQLAVGLADNLSGVDVVDSEVNFRRSGGGAISDGVARIEAIKGNSVVWNQLALPFNELTNTAFYSFSIANGVLTITALREHTANSAAIRMKNSTISGHSYLFTIDGSNSQNIDMQYRCGSAFNRFSVPIANAVSEADLYIYPFGALSTTIPAGATATIKSWGIHDLTKMFQAGNEPTTIEEFYARIPMGVDLNAYNEGEVIHMDVQSIESQGVNAWDEEWENGTYNRQDGSPTTNPNIVRCKNAVGVLPNMTYHFNTPIPSSLSDKSYMGYAVFYDSDDVFISSQPMGGTYYANVLTPTNARYMRFYLRAEYGATYNHDICINISDTSINGKYFPYIKRVEDLSIIRKYFPQGMKSAGSAHDEIYYDKMQNKKFAVQRFGEVDLGTLTYAISTAYDKTSYNAPLTDAMVNSSWSVIPNLCCAKYLAGTPNSASGIGTEQDVISITPQKKIAIVPSKEYNSIAELTADLQGVMLYYELETPIVTELDAEDQFKDLDYQVWNCGTEKAIAEGKSAPLAADITYGFNAIGKIKELESLVAALRAKVGI